MAAINPRLIIHGEPNEIWVNDTGRPYYQVVCSLTNTCAVCLQYHLRISRYWPLPMHASCRCRQVRVAMGEPAPHPFCDYQELARSFSQPDRAKLMGAANFRLWDSGVVPWESIVTASRVRPLHQVVARERLTVDQMTRVGISRSVARQAYDAVHTPEHLAVAAHRRALLERIAGAGMAHDAVVRHLAGAIPARVMAAPVELPAPAPVMPESPPVAAAPPHLLGRPPDLTEVRRQRADELTARLISGSSEKRAAMRGRSGPRQDQQTLFPVRP